MTVNSARELAKKHLKINRMKPHEEYAESIFNRIDKELSWIEKDYPVDLYRDKLELTRFVIEKQIETKDQLGLVSTHSLFYYNKKMIDLISALEYLKNK